MKKNNPNFNININSKSYNQELYLKYIKDPLVKILFVIGPAGTGKTYIACHNAITLLKNGDVKKIIITRPVVPVEEDLGFLPGTLNKKMDPWTRPIFDVFEEHYTKQEIEKFILNNVIEISPLAYMRGRTFKNSFIIADEMQNSSPNQMLMLTTRIGENSKMIITGDLKQTDKPLMSGLNDFLDKYYIYRSNYFKYNYNETLLKEGIDLNNKFITDSGIQVLELFNSDIQRSKVVGKILEIYNNDFNLKIVNNFKQTRYNYLRKNNNTVINKNIIKLDNDAALIPKYMDK
jgi:phosphate starvation-inducible PhoH-like protein